MKLNSIFKVGILSSLITMSTPAAKKVPYIQPKIIANKIELSKVDIPPITIPKDGTIVENIYGKGYPKPIYSNAINSKPVNYAQIRPF